MGDPRVSDDLNRRLCVAPMMDWTDRHCRYFLRLVCPRALLYTEMVTAQAVLHGDAARLLAFNGAEHPVALQLGGSEPRDLARAARVGAEAGYDEINLNIGCPSDRVQSGRFGACLMADPLRVADCIAAMRAAVDLPVTVKCRLGIDEHDSYGFLRDFVDPVAEAGCRVFVVHARIALLQGLSPKANREVPPLRYERVYRLKADRPDLCIVLNGGIRRVEDARRHLKQVDGIMIGREAYRNPWMLAETAADLFGDVPRSREEVARAMMDYLRRQLGAGIRASAVTRHMLGLYANRPGARHWRRRLTEGAARAGATEAVIADGLEAVLRGSPRLPGMPPAALSES